MAVSAVLQVSLSLMFVAAGVFAVAAIVSSWRNAAPAIAALGREIAALDNGQQLSREVSYRIAATGIAVSPQRLRLVSVRKTPGSTVEPSTGLRVAA